MKGGVEKCGKVCWGVGKEKKVWGCGKVLEEV